MDDLQTVLPMIVNQRRLAPPNKSLLIAVSGLDGSGSRANLRGFSEICAWTGPRFVLRRDIVYLRPLHTAQRAGADRNGLAEEAAVGV